MHLRKQEDRITYLYSILVVLTSFLLNVQQEQEIFWFLDERIVARNGILVECRSGNWELFLLREITFQGSVTWRAH